MYMGATCKYSDNHNSPLDQQLDGHALTTHTYLGVEAIAITIQVNGIHTIARRMDDESKNCNKVHPPTLVLR